MDPAKAMEAMQGVMQNPAFMQMAEKLGSQMMADPSMVGPRDLCARGALTVCPQCTSVPQPLKVCPCCTFRPARARPLDGLPIVYLLSHCPDARFTLCDSGPYLQASMMQSMQDPATTEKMKARMEALKVGSNDCLLIVSTDQLLIVYLSACKSQLHPNFTSLSALVSLFFMRYLSD